MTPHFLIWSFGPKIGSVDRICHQTDSMNRFYLDVKAVVKYVGGFWPIGVFFAGYRSFFFVPSRQTQTKARL